MTADPMTAELYHGPWAADLVEERIGRCLKPEAMAAMRIAGCEAENTAGNPDLPAALVAAAQRIINTQRSVALLAATHQCLGAYVANAIRRRRPAYPPEGGTPAPAPLEILREIGVALALHADDLAVAWTGGGVDQTHLRGLARRLIRGRADGRRFSRAADDLAAVAFAFTAAAAKAADRKAGAA